MLGKNSYIDIDTLVIKKITVNEGPHYKRQIPRAQGACFFNKKKIKSHRFSIS